MLNINNNFVLQPIKDTDNTSRLSLGNASYTPLKIFLQKDAFDFHQYEIAKTFVLINPQLSPTRIWGYMSLMNSEIVLNKKQRPCETLSTKKYEAFPAVKIARLAIDKSLHGQGLGRMLLDWSINYVQIGVMPLVGCRYMTVDAKRDSVSFYKKNGFTLLEVENEPIDDNPSMFYDLYKANQAAKLEKWANNTSGSTYAIDKS